MAILSHPAVAPHIKFTYLAKTLKLSMFTTPIQQSIHFYLGKNIHDIYTHTHTNDKHRHGAKTSISAMPPKNLTFLDICSTLIGVD